MPTTLRSRQKQVARELILQAAADEIVERGLEDLSLQAVADRAGVSKRTLYNYFDDRETLLAAIGTWSAELTAELGGSNVPGSLDALPETMRSTWRAWHEQGTVFEAVLRIDAAATVSEGRRVRRVALAAAVAQVRPDLTEEQSASLALILHVLPSSPTYKRLTVEDGLDLERATVLVTWALRTLTEAITQGKDPFSGEETE